MLKELFGGSSSSTLLDSAFDDVSRMLNQAETMYDHAVSAFLDNAPLEVDLDDLDDVVDEGERMVRRTVLQHLSVNPQQDLVASLILVSLVQDAERIGDFARGLAELVPLAQRERGGEFRDRLRVVADSLRPLFAKTRQCFKDDDPNIARDVISTVTGNKKVLIALTSDIASSDVSADMAVVYSAAARILRRIGSHLSNICSSVSQPYDRIRHGDEEA
jgi:phosphate uptake regulator